MKHLLDPLAFRNGIEARNRVVLAPMTNQQSHADGTLSDDELNWLTLRAEGGFGTVMTCASHVAKDGQGWPGELGIFDDALLPGLTRLATALKRQGALALVQIFHGGFRADSKLTGETPWTATATASENDGIADPSLRGREATDEDIARVIRQFADAAVRAHAAGMDGVEIHGAHGYLLAQFLSATQNRRTDGWGGSLENRARLAREITRAVRARVPASFVVGVRLSPEDYGNAKGLDLDESLSVTRWLCDDGVDFVHISLWNALRNTLKRPAEHAVSAFRAVVPKDIMLLVAGSVWTRDEADQMLALGADAVALGRSAIANPDWPLRLADPSWVPRRPPLSAEELRARGLSDGFVTYMRRWKEFVAP